MSQQVRDFEKTLAAGEDMDSELYYIVQLAADGDLELGEGATDLLVGVLQNKPKDTEAAIYRFLGTTKVVVAGVINVGAWVTSDSAGKAVATTTDKNTVVGRALEAAASDGDIIEIQLGIFTLDVS